MLSGEVVAEVKDVWSFTSTAPHTCTQCGVLSKYLGQLYLTSHISSLIMFVSIEISNSKTNSSFTVYINVDSLFPS
jgi:hypothetical protein